MSDQAVKRAAIYLRVSTAAQAERDGDPEGYSIPAQREACLRKAESLGAVVVDEYADKGESARTADRPGLQAMLSRIETERDIDFVIVHKVDRLARNRFDDLTINMALQAAGAKLISVSEGIDATPSGLLLHGILAEMAQFYSRNLAQEIIKGTTQKAKSGGTPFTAPIGYLNVRRTIDGKEVRTIDTDPSAAPLVQYAFESYAQGNQTLDTLLADLTARGLRQRPTAKRAGKPLGRTQLANMLHNKYYMGIVTYKGVEYAGRHQPLVSPELFEHVQTVFDSHGSGEKQRVHDHYLKSSVFCARCGSRLCFDKARGNGGAYFYYFCLGRRRGCTQPYILIEDLEKAICDYYATIQMEPERVETIRTGVLAEMDAERKHSNVEIRRQERRLLKLTGQRDKLLKAHYAGAIPLEQLKREQDRISRETGQAERLLASHRLVFAEVEGVLTDALSLAGDCQASYREAEPFIRRLMNQAIFEKLFVEGDRVKRAELTEGFAALMAEDLARRIHKRSTERVLSEVGSNKRALVETTGFEPATSWLQTRRSTD